MVDSYHTQFLSPKEVHDYNAQLERQISTQSKLTEQFFGSDVARKSDVQDSSAKGFLNHDSAGRIASVKSSDGATVYTASYGDDNRVTNITFANQESIQRQSDDSYRMRYNAKIDDDLLPAIVSDLKVLPDGRISWKVDDRTTVITDRLQQKTWINGKLSEPKHLDFRDSEAFWDRQIFKRPEQN